MSVSSFVLLWYPPWERGLLEFLLGDSGMGPVLFMLIFCRVNSGPQNLLVENTVRLTSIHLLQIGGKFTETSGGSTNLFYGCKD
jgi:hypothetical protein